jgi:hypothetical protein
LYRGGDRDDDDAELSWVLDNVGCCNRLRTAVDKQHHDTTREIVLTACLICSSDKEGRAGKNGPADIVFFLLHNKIPKSPQKIPSIFVRLLLLGTNTARGDGGMAATPFLDTVPFATGEAFGPEAIETMAIAYEKVCTALGLVGRPSQLNELIARNIIELATCGVYDAERLSAGVLAIYKQAAE